jgi:PKD repeat protein
MKKFAQLLFALLLGTALQAQQVQPVRFANEVVYFPENFSEMARTPIQDEEMAEGYFARYLQVHKLPTADQRRKLEQLGVVFAGYVHHQTYLVLLPSSFALSNLVSLAPRSLMAPAPQWKMHRNLLERPFGDWAVQGDLVDLQLQLYPTISIETGIGLCEKAGMQVLQKGIQNGFLAVRVPQDQLESIAKLPFVRWIELQPEPSEPEDLNGRSLHRSNLLDSDHPLGKKYNGEGVNVLVRDDGAVGPHIDFQGRLFNQDGVGAPTSGTHGDGVAGIIGGAGNLDPTKKGMAAGSDVYVVDYTADFQDGTMPLFFNQNVTITNSSYSNGCNAGYTLASQTVDQQIFQNEGLMHVFSAGNSNGQNCNYGAGNQWGNITGGHKMAKNAIATANLRVNGALETSSSRGPAHDGRLKPDISAHGAEQNSTNPNNGYQVFGGTSAAAPGIAGCLAQLTHAYRTIKDTSLAPTALLKTALLNTANDLGVVGPDFKFGWGHINTFRSLRLLEQERYSHGLVEQGDTSSHAVTIPFGTKQAKMMLYWVDPPADENAAKALLNDLDIRLISPAGDVVYLPWKLDPTPNAITLDLPAGLGRDSLNNTEQVAISNPAPGTYRIEVIGYEVPFGPQEYVVAWEFLNDQVQLTFPNGGESFVPGTAEWIRWDAYDNTDPFFLRYSTDGGQNFIPIGSYNNDVRMLQWTVPNITTGSLKLLLIRGNRRDTSDFNLTAAPLPTNVAVEKVCPDSITVSWTKVANDTLAYEVLALGEKYMDLKGTSAINANQFTFAISDATQEQWISARTSHPSGLTGRRTNAIYWPGGLKGCPQPNDVALNSLLSIGSGAIVTCGASSKEVVIRAINEGQNTASGATATYQLDNEPPVTEVLPDIAPGDTLDYTFNTPLTLTQNATVNLIVSLDLQDDNYTANNSVQQSFTVVANATATPFTVDFEAADLPAGWSVLNPDGGITWSSTPNTVTGFDGTPTNTIRVNHFNYSAQGQLDHLYAIPFDLTNMTDPVLRFNYAHAQYNASYNDGLRVEVFPSCNLGEAPVVVWERFDPELATFTSTSNWTPTSADQWRSEVVDLKPYAGQTLVVRFTAVNDYGNNTYLDNVSLANLSNVAPVAFFVAADTLCRLDSTLFVAEPSPDPSHTYTWTFGAGATPSTATGLGPHSVIYTFAGNRTINLYVSNGFATDTLTKTVNIRSFPVSSFTSSNDGLTVTFTNTSQNADAYLWDFGDGNTSTESNPVHTYLATGQYEVKLSAINTCRTIKKTNTVTLTSGTLEQLGIQSAKILPNPSSGAFSLEINNQLGATNAQLRLVDATGKTIHRLEQVYLPLGKSLLAVHGSSLPAGNYRLMIQTERGSTSLPVVIVE